METPTAAKKHCVIERILSYKTLVFSIVTNISQFVWMSWPKCSSFHCMTTVHGCPECGLSFILLSLSLKCTTPLLTVLTPTSPASSTECQWVPFFLHGGIKWHTFAPYALPCQMPFCHTATKCNRILVEGPASTFIPPTSATDMWADKTKQEALLLEHGARSSGTWSF